MRLPVILVQQPPAGQAALAEALVGHLIGRPGLDLTLVDRFDAIAPDSTDRMTLEAITVPSAVLDWQSPPEMLRSLESVGFAGRRCPHRLDPEVEPAGGGPRRRLFLFDLNVHQDAETIQAELERLRDSLNVRTFSLESLAGTAPAAKAAIIPPAQQPPTVDDRAATKTPEDASTSSRTPPPPATTAPPAGSETRNAHVPAKAATSTGSGAREGEPSDESLDDLIDQLDRLDV